jgi:hypothetical protein
MSCAEVVGVGRNGNNTTRAIATRGSFCSHFFISEVIVTKRHKTGKVSVIADLKVV